MASTCLIFNPVARGGKARRLRMHLDTFASFCTLLPTTCAGDARRLAMEAVAQGFETIIAAGGDGTVNEVLNGMADCPGGLDRARLGVLPMGTVNVFAREMRMPRRMAEAFEVLRRGNELRIDLPLAEFVSGGKTVRRHFIQLAGAGLDARAVELVSWELKKKTGPAAYVVAGIKAWLEKHPLIKVTGAGSATGEAVLFGNGRYYGGAFHFFPQANLQDGLLDACVFPKVNVIQVTLLLLGLAGARPHCFASSLILRAPEFTLASDTRVSLQLDGENAGELPAKLSILPKALRVIVP